MPTCPTTRALDHMIERLERRLEVVRGIRDLVADDLELAKDLAASLSENGNGQPPQSPEIRIKVKATHYTRIKDYFNKRGNRWASAPKITRATGLNRGAVGYVLYKTRKDRFERKPHPTDGKLKLWRLKGGEAND